MKRFIHTGLLAAALFLGLGMDSPREAHALTAQNVYARLEVQGLGDLKGAWDAAMAERAEMVGTLKALSSKYRAEVDAIASLKQAGVGSLNRRELERRLRDAQALATQLDSLQAEIARRDALMRQISDKIVSVLDAERLLLEKKIVKGGSHKTLITTLNELSAERERYARALPEFDQKRYADVLRDAHDVQDPDDMLAMADELLDAEGEVRAQMAALDGQIDTLRTRRNLLRRANDFRREESFFEEDDRARTFGTRTRVNTPQRGDVTSNEESSSPPAKSRDEQAPSVGNPTMPSQPVVTTDADDDSNSPALGAPEAGGAPVDGFSSDAEQGRGSMTPDPGLTDNPGTLGVPSAEGAGSDPFGTPTDVVVVVRQADPNVSVGSSSVPDARIDGQIRNLETEREQLDRKAKELRKQAKQLKKRANQID